MLYVPFIIRMCLRGPVHFYLWLLDCRKKDDNTYQRATWQIKFNLDKVDHNGIYKLRVALASATVSELQVWKSSIDH
jgi:hypothetical protein